MTLLSPQKKKIPYSISGAFRNYLTEINRTHEISVQYADLLRFTNCISLYDKQGKDTLWLSISFSQSDMEELNRELTGIYATLKTNGDITVMEHLHVDRIDFCTFGNSKPFRIKIINNYNDNYDYYYIKLADSSRVYGLEWEHILSPTRINYFVNDETLVEEHIVGIPGDQFISNNLTDTGINQTRLAKEFIKFNERCLVRLLGDMRSYNYVIDVTPDFEDTQYRIRAIDFDQQSYEGRKNLYLPQYFKENNAFVQMSSRLLNANTVKQYQAEERSLIARRIKSSKYRVQQLLDVMVHDELSSPEKIDELKNDLSVHYGNTEFLKCRNMGEIMKISLNMLVDGMLV